MAKRLLKWGCASAVALLAVGSGVEYVDRRIRARSMASAKCDFCSTDVRGSNVAYETARWMVVVPHKPLVAGHLLLVPKAHVNDLTAEDAPDFVKARAKVAGAYRKGFNTDDAVEIRKRGLDAGQSVPHYHMHLYPRGRDASQLLFIGRFGTDFLSKPLPKATMTAQVAEYKAMFADTTS